MSERHGIGEVAKKLQVSTRTLRFYDQKGLLKPTKAENGYRFYNEDQVQQLQVIIYLKELGFSLAKIKTLLQADHAQESLALLVNAQLQSNNEEIEKFQTQQKQLHDLQKILTKQSNLELTDLTKMMTNETILKKFRRRMLVYGLLLDAIEIIGIILAFYFGKRGNDIGVIASVGIMLLVVVFGAFKLSLRYYKAVAYVCPHCGHTFVPSFRTFMFAAHTPKMRKLRCPNCHEKSYCLEVGR